MAIETELLVKAIGKGFDELNEDVETLGDGMGNLDNAAKSSSTKWTELSSKLDVAQQAFAAVAGTAQAVYETMKEGATIKAAATNFETLSASMGSSESVMNGLRGATSGMVDDMTLMSNANSLMTMGIASTSEELNKNFQIVTALKKPTDSAAEAMENWAALMANQSLPRLDSFGISSGAVKVRINELMAETKGLTREQAFNTAVLEEAETAMGNVADTTQGQLANIERLEASWTNLTNAGKVAIANFLTPSVEALSNQANQLGEMAAATENGRSAWTNYVTIGNEVYKTFGIDIFEDYTQGLKDAESAAFTMTQRSEAQAIAMQGVADVIPMTTEEMIAYSAAAAEAAGENEDLTDKLAQQSNHLSDSEVRLAASAAGQEALAESAAAAAAELKKETAASAQLLAESGKLFSAYADGSGELGFFNESLDELGTQMVSVGGVTAEQSSDLGRLQSAYDKAATTISDYELGIKGANLTDEQRNKKIADQQAIMSTLSANMEPLINITGELVEVNNELTINQGALNSGMLAAAEAGGASAEQLALLSLATGELSEAEANALIQQVALEQSLAALGAQYADGTLNIDQYVAAAEKAVAEVSELTVSSEAAKIESENLGAASFKAAHAMTIESGKAENLTEALVSIPDVKSSVKVDGLDDAIGKSRALEHALRQLEVGAAVESGQARVTSGGGVGLAGGGSFIIPPGFSNDTFPLMPGVNGQSGERVTVTPAGQRGGGSNITINVNGAGNPSAVANRVNDKLLQAQRAAGDI